MGEHARVIAARRTRPGPLPRKTPSPKPHLRRVPCKRKPSTTGAPFARPGQSCQSAVPYNERRGVAAGFIHTVYKGATWVNEVEGNDEPLARTFATKEEAVVAGP